MQYDDNEPFEFSYSTAVFDTTDPNVQCRETMANDCVSCDSLLDLTTPEGRAAVTAAQTCPDCSLNRGRVRCLPVRLLCAVGS
eukprot:3931738-Rhodomonas_salina.1